MCWGCTITHTYIHEQVQMQYIHSTITLKNRGTDRADVAVTAKRSLCDRIRQSLTVHHVSSVAFQSAFSDRSPCERRRKDAQWPPASYLSQPPLPWLHYSSHLSAVHKQLFLKPSAYTSIKSQNYQLPGGWFWLSVRPPTAITLSQHRNTDRETQQSIMYADVCVTTQVPPNNTNLNTTGKGYSS